MGLDNIPREYPCATKATRDSDNRIDCVKTQEENNCPWKNEKESSPMVKNIGKKTSVFTLANKGVAVLTILTTPDFELTGLRISSLVSYLYITRLAALYNALPISSS